MLNIDVSLTIGKMRFDYRLESSNRRLVLFGPSGSGKSTLLKLLAGFFQPDKGYMVIHDRVFFSSRSRINVPIHERRLGYLPQEATLFPHLGVRENITYGAQFALAKGREDSDQRLTFLLERLEIGDKLEHDTKDLSGGEKQRVALARALFVRPDLLLLDEPFSGLDSLTRVRLRDLVLSLSEEMGFVTIFVTHDLEEAYIVGQDMAVIQDRRVLEYGRAQDIFVRPQKAATARLLDFGNEFALRELYQTTAITEDGWLLEHEADLSIAQEKIITAFIRPDQVLILREDTPSMFRRENILSCSIERIYERIRFVEIWARCQPADGAKNKAMELSPSERSLRIELPHHSAKRLKLYLGKQIYVSLKKESLTSCSESMDV